MSENNNVQNVLDITVDKMRAMADADTIIGEKIELADGISAIPVFKVSYGFAGGGSDFVTKNIGNRANLFGGGGGGGMTVTPIAFLITKGTDVQILNIHQSDPSCPNAISLIPEMFDKIVNLCKDIKHDRDAKNSEYNY